MSARKALLMALVLITGLGFLWVQENRPADDIVAEGGRERILTGINVESIDKLHLISGSGGSSFGVFREAAHEQESAGRAKWVLREPLGAPAKSEIVGELLQALVELETKNIVPAEEVNPDQSAYGLLPPGLVIRLQGSFGEEVLSFGRTHTVTGRRFLQREGDPRIFLVEEEDFKAVNRSYEEVRSRQPLQFDPKSVSSVLIIQGTRDPLLLERVTEDAERWLLKDPRVVQPADAALIMKELSALAEVEVLRFLPPGGAPLETFGLNQPSLMLHLRFDKPVASAAPGYSEKELILHFAEGPELAIVDENSKVTTLGLYFFRVAGQQWIYELEQPFYRGWLQPPWHFFLKKPYSRLDQEQVKEIRISGQNTASVTLRKGTTAGSWLVNREGSGENGTTLNHDIIAPWMENLFQLRVLSYLSVELPDAPELTAGDEHGLDYPWLEVELNTAEGQLIRLALGKSLDAEEEAGAGPAPRYALIDGAEMMRSLVILSAAEVRALTPSREILGSEGEQGSEAAEQGPDSTAGLEE